MYWSNVACANRQLVPALVQRMETLFLETVSTTLHSKDPIDVTTFQIRNETRYDVVTLCDSDGNERYQLSVVDSRYGGYPTCVWLDPPPIPESDKREKLLAAAKRVNCIRLIAVDKKPPEVSISTAETELLHFAKVLAAQGLFLERQQRLESSREIRFFHNGTTMR